MQTSGATAEAESGGVLVNVVPRDGGNTFRGIVRRQLRQPGAAERQPGRRAARARRHRRRRRSASGTTSAAASAARSCGTSCGSSRARDTGSRPTYVPGNYFNATPGTLFYTPDLSRPAYDENYYFDKRLRLTWQASRAAQDRRDRTASSATATASTTSAPACATRPRRAAPNTGRTATASHMELAGHQPPAVRGRRHVRVAASSSGCGVGSTPGDPAVLDQSRNYRYGNHRFGYGLSDSFGYQKTFQMNERFAASVRTGSHSFKAGIQYLYAPRETYFYQDGGPSRRQNYTFLRHDSGSVTYYAGAARDDRCASRPRRVRAGPVERAAADAEPRACGSIT